MSCKFLIFNDFTPLPSRRLLFSQLLIFLVVSRWEITMNRAAFTLLSRSYIIPERLLTLDNSRDTSSEMIEKPNLEQR